MSKGGNHKLNIVTSKSKIAIAGPADKESEARLKLYNIIYDILSECLYFNSTLMDDWVASEIAYRKAVYQKTKARKDIFVNVKSLNVLYRNPPSYWKIWAKIVDNKNVASMGSKASFEDLE
jgi:hypothetical protein